MPPLFLVIIAYIEYKGVFRVAIQSFKTLGELRAECRALGLAVDHGGKRETKSNYIMALQEHYITNKYGYRNCMPESLKLRLEIESPMLCQRYSVLSTFAQEEIWESPNWILELKENGIRCLPIFSSSGLDFYSRNIDETNYCPINYRDMLYLDNVDTSKIKNRFILDAEIVSTSHRLVEEVLREGRLVETEIEALTALFAMDIFDAYEIQKRYGCNLEYRIFDILWWDGEWLLEKPLIQRVEYVDKAIQQLQEAGLACRRPYSTLRNKKAFFNTMVSSGMEGCVAKNLLAPYNCTTSRTKTGYVKIKSSMIEVSQRLEMEDTVDAFITGYRIDSDYVSALEFSVYLEDELGNKETHIIATVTNLTQDLKERLTELGDDGLPILDKTWYGRCAAISGQCVSHKSLKLKHALLVEWRADKTANECVIDLEWLRSLIL